MKKIILGAICILCLQGVDCMQGRRVQQQLQGTVQIQNLKEVSDNVFYAVRYLMTLHDYCDGLPNDNQYKSGWLQLLSQKGNDFITLMDNVRNDGTGVVPGRLTESQNAVTEQGQYIEGYSNNLSQMHLKLLKAQDLAY